MGLVSPVSFCLPPFSLHLPLTAHSRAWRGHVTLVVLLALPVVQRGPNLTIFIEIKKSVYNLLPACHFLLV